MLRWSLSLAALLVALVLGAFIAQCSNPPDSGESGPAAAFNQSEAADLLPGTWLREYTEQGMQVRRLLTLDAHGGFHEVSRVTEPNGQVSEFVHEGTWVFDGSNLKRRYVSVNGESPSRLTMPFATFAIVFDTRNEFTGVDHIHGRTIHYLRVLPETEL
jgi:hypothetical protein